MLHLGKQLASKAPKLNLTAAASLSGGKVQSTTQSTTSIRNLNQHNSNNNSNKLVNYNLCHKRLSSGSASQSSSVSSMKRLAGKVAVVTASTDG